MVEQNSRLSNTEKVIKGMSSQTIVTIVIGIVEIISFSIMSRLLTAEDFGYYAAVTAITTVFASLSETGMGAALIQKKDLNQRFINNVFTISLMFGAFISLLLFLLSGFLSKMVLDESLSTPLKIMSVTLLCNCLVSVNTSIMQRRLQFLRIGIINLTSIIVTTSVAVILAVKGYGFYAILIKGVLGSLLTLLLSFFFVNCRFGFNLDKTTFKSIFGFSGWLMASVFFRNFAQQADRLIMGRLLSVSSLGAYNRPKEFVNQITNKLGGIFDTALFPVLSSVQDKKDSLKNAFSSSLYYMNLFGMLLSLTMLFNSDFIIRIFFGEEWLTISVTFKILSVLIIAYFLTRLTDCYLRSLALTKQQFYFRILELALNVCGLVVGARWDINGVAFALLFSTFCVTCLKIRYVAKKIGFCVKDTFSILLSAYRPSVVVLPFALIFLLIFPHTLWGSALNAIVFFIMVGLLFLCFPSVVGKRYKDEIYVKLFSAIKKRMKK